MWTPSGSSRTWATTVVRVSVGHGRVAGRRVGSWDHDEVDRPRRRGRPSRCAAIARLAGDRPLPRRPHVRSTSAPSSPLTTLSSSPLSPRRSDEPERGGESAWHFCPLGRSRCCMTVVATAGHVDHGKSSLVLALTGTDPDRFEEEKRRGLTIDLGFAHTVLPVGSRTELHRRARSREVPAQHARRCRRRERPASSSLRRPRVGSRSPRNTSGSSELLGVRVRRRSRSPRSTWSTTTCSNSRRWTSPTTSRARSSTDAPIDPGGGDGRSRRRRDAPRDSTS